MIKILNQNRQYVAYLENAFGIGYEKQFNSVWSASFSLPLNDPKNAECLPLNYVELTDNGEYIGLYRIMPKKTVKNETTQTATYTCEHVLGTLLDSSLFKYHQLDNITTTEVLQYLLSKQDVKHWKLGTVSFTRYFSYKWENDNLLSALFSVPKPFDQQYQWTWDTTSYPWTLNLVAPENAVTCEIREKKNLRGLELEENPMGVYNRIYPLGYGEGDNQLTIESVNGGVPYVEDTASIAQFGIREYVWADRRFEDAASLKASALALLREWKEIQAYWRISAADISSITGEDIDKFKMGRIVRLNVEGLPVTDLRIMKEAKTDLTGQPGDIQLEIGSLSGDLSTTQADLERRQQVNELYAQGATNIDSANIAENADSTHPVKLDLWLDSSVVKVNKFELTFRTEKFRAYERAIEGGGAVVSSTGGGGGTVKSSSSGGGVSKSTSSGGSSTQTSSSGGGTTATSSAGGDHTHKMFDYTNDSDQIQNPYRDFAPQGGTGFHVTLQAAAPVDLYTAGGSGDHSHSVTIPSHQHTVSIPAHTHEFSTPDHSHSLTLEDHTHSITLPNHVHGIDYGIWESNETATAVTIKVNGNTVPHTSTSGNKIDLVPYLPVDGGGKIMRGTWITVEITPNKLGRIVAHVEKQVFIQSRGDYSL